MKGKRGTLAALAAAVLLAAALLAGYFMTRPETHGGEKDVELLVIHGDGTRREFELETNAEYLGEVLLERGIIAGTEGEYGLYVETVDGETADPDAQQWWCLTREGERLSTGVDTTPIADGDDYELTLTTGW